MKKVLMISACVLTACASHPDKIGATYVSPMQYSGYNCKQIAMEMTNVSRRASELYGTLEKDADNDSTQMGVGLILFWPTLFFLEGGDGPQAAEYARIKGERDALEAVAVQKQCDMAAMPRFVEPEPKQTNASQYPS